MKNFNVEEVTEHIRSRLQSQGRKAVENQMKQLQLTVYVMCGGGMLGASAAENPDDFYIDARCGKRPYSNRAIFNSVATLSIYASVLGIPGRDLDRGYMEFYNCGVF